MATPIIIYVETNWLVSCVLPHDGWRLDALELFRHAEEGRCELRIPELALLEARHVIEGKAKQHATSIGDIATSLANVARNLERQDLLELASNLVNAERSYNLTNPQEALTEVIEKCRGFAISDPTGELRILDQLREAIHFRGKDIVDFYVLSAVAAHRECHPEPRAAFLSMNSSEFSDSTATPKVPRDFYTTRKLVYLATFDLNEAEKRWDAADRTGWRVPTRRQIDTRVSEGQKLLQKISPDKLDQALDCIKRLHAS